ncbi:MAG TPA: nitrite reductase large subunit NirB, partial [Puia sp.]|nr:nitrite reductase large subunit NirB [Puia sp.]
MSTSNKPVVVVIGNGMVGHKFCEKLMAASDDFQIVVFGEEPRPAYDRVHLSEYFNGKTASDLSLSMAGWFDAERDIALHIGDPVREIDRAAKVVHSRKGIVQPYDYLVLATGSAAFVPDIPGVEKQGVFVYRTIEDLDLIKAYATQARHGAVMGGGLLGLEAAKALLDLGIPHAHVIEFASRLMPRQIDSAGSHILETRLAKLGLQIHLNKSTLAVEGEGRITRLRFADDTTLDLDMLVISAGIRPRDELARLAGLQVGTRGGILVNEKMQTSDPRIFALGECALAAGMIYGLVAPGYEMADVAASQLAGGHKTFTGFDMSTKLKLIGVDVASFGDAFISEPDSRTIVFEDRHKGIYKRINITGDGTRLLGGVLIGDAAAYNMLLQTAGNRLPLPPDPEDLVLGSRGGTATGAGVMDLPDEALICSCEAVTKAAICNAVTEKGVETIDGMKKCTKAGTGCGGCVPLVKDLISGTLKANGKYIRNVICEHFDQSRQELLHLVKLHSVKTFDEVLGRWGKGDGCEVCKPAVASILASCWNDNI